MTKQGWFRRRSAQSARLGHRGAATDRNKPWRLPPRGINMPGRQTSSTVASPWKRQGEVGALGASSSSGDRPRRRERNSTDPVRARHGELRPRGRLQAAAACLGLQRGGWRRRDKASSETRATRRGNMFLPPLPLALCNKILHVPGVRSYRMPVREALF